jgi:DNA-nicking Smr family endonuclease
MSRRVRPEELRLWGLVAATVRPSPGRRAPRPSIEERQGSPMILTAETLVQPIAHKRQPAPEDIEPNRKRHIVRGHQPLEARLDLHGLDQDRARAALESFLSRAQADGHRSALVITGRGLQGDGVLRRRTPEWLSAPHLRPIVAGFSQAHQKHGGDGALYVAIKKKRG